MRIPRLSSFFAVLFLFNSSNLFAGDESGKEDMLQILAKGGPVMYVLMAISFLACCLVFYYLLSLRTSVVVPKEFIIQAENAIAKKDFEMLSKVCEENNSPASKIIAAGSNIFLRSKNNYQMIKDAVEDEGVRQAGLLWHRIRALQDIAVIAPMVGLLGTVLGMIKSFMNLGAESHTPKPTEIAGGVSMALITTAAGLIIGILAMIIYSFFRAQINRILTELENSCNKIAVEMMVVDSDEESPF
jgi:biopolymer transport protein ExbB